ncbi:MAG: pyridoxal-phosphate dependent enzyme [Nitrospinota bacterium]|nr:MAG: pyridoxal-phosphate dependent enzyme [Nitrospinota bacterium]
MPAPLVHLFCPLCRQEFPLSTGYLRCPHSRPERAHPLEKRYARELERLNLPSRWLSRQTRNPFLRYREAAGSFYLAREVRGEGGYEAMVSGLEARCNEHYRQGLQTRPLFAADTLASQLGLAAGRLWVKDETGNLMGSHKFRHLTGALLYLEVSRHLPGRGGEKTPLAIFSCGNAALAAAALARAAEYPLYAFVPFTVNPQVESLLSQMGAWVVKVKREGGPGEGDPCYRRFQEAVETFSWTPFSCYGYDLWPSIEGGETLGWELLTELAEQGRNLDVLVVQVGGGGLAHALIRALRLGRTMGLLPRLPRIYTCQTGGCYPLFTGYAALLQFLASQGAITLPGSLQQVLSEQERCWRERYGEELQRVAGQLAGQWGQEPFQQALYLALRQREKLFSPWDRGIPSSIAEGILDDTPYDGLEVCEGMLESGGFPVIVDEEQLFRAREMARETTGIDVSATGSAGLAGLLELLRMKAIRPQETVGLLFTGVERREVTVPARPENIVSLGQGEDIRLLTRYTRS